MKRSLFVVVGMLLMLFHSSLPANAAGSSCVNTGYPSVSSTSTSINVSVSVSTNCKNPFGLSGGGPVYTIVGESTFSSSCTGPYDYGMLSYGTINCTISLGGLNGSTRTGATSSTLHIWFAYDFSTKDITFSHSAIPSRGGSSTGNTGSGSGSSGGNGAATSGIVPAPVKPACTAAPDVPILSISHPDENMGPVFRFQVAPTGQPTVSLYYNFALYDSGKKAWDNWNGWTLINSTTGLLGTVIQSKLEVGKSRIVFSVYAENSCGQSNQSRETPTHSGILLIAEASLKEVVTSQNRAISDELAALDKSILDFPNSTSALAEMKLKIPSLPVMSGNPDADSPLIQIYRNDVLTWISATNREIDKAAADALAAQKAADAAAKALADKQKADALAAQKAAQKISTITCTKGKLSKTVSAVKPVCPVGYRKK